MQLVLAMIYLEKNVHLAINNNHSLSCVCACGDLQITQIFVIGNQTILHHSSLCKPRVMPSTAWYDRMKGTLNKCMLKANVNRVFELALNCHYTHNSELDKVICWTCNNIDICLDLLFYAFKNRIKNKHSTCLSNMRNFLM